MPMPTAFQARMMQSVVEEHAGQTAHSANCCEIANRYRAILKGMGKSAPAAEKRPTYTPARNGQKMATPGQITLVWNMLADRKCTPEMSKEFAETLKGGDITSEKIRSMIETLTRRPYLATSKGSDAMVRRPNAAQLGYLKGLLGERIWDEPIDYDELTFTSVSKLIDRVKEAPRKLQSERVTDGIYVLDGVYVKVQKAVHGSGHRYTKVFDPQTGTWEKQGRLLGKLTPEHRISREAAKAFGDLYGRCIKCSATLTDEESISRGMGPVCAERLGF